MGLRRAKQGERFLGDSGVSRAEGRGLQGADLHPRPQRPPPRLLQPRRPCHAFSNPSDHPHAFSNPDDHPHAFSKPDDHPPRLFQPRRPPPTPSLLRTAPASSCSSVSTQRLLSEPPACRVPEHPTAPLPLRDTHPPGEQRVAESRLCPHTGHSAGAVTGARRPSERKMGARADHGASEWTDVRV